MIETLKVKVPIFMQESEPNKEKVNRIMEYCKQYNMIDKPVEIRRDNVLKKHYIRWLVAKIMRLERIPVVYC